MLSIAFGFDFITTALISLNMKWLTNVTDELDDRIR